MNRQMPPLQAFESGLAYQENFQALSSLLEPHVSYNSSWIPPPMGTYKLNVDGALFPELHRGGVGHILRDWKGEVLLASTMNEQDVEDPVIIESLAILRRLQHCLHQGIPSLIVESDCQFVVQEALKAKSPNSETGNTAAHQLARYAQHELNIVIWGRELPESIVQAVWFDQNSL